jgi:hypothetical protein
MRQFHAIVIFSLALLLSLPVNAKPIPESRAKKSAYQLTD